MEQAAIYELLAEKLGDGALGWHDDGVEPLAAVAPERIAEAAAFLRRDERLSFELLMCLSGIDWDGYDEEGKGKSVAILGYAPDGRPETSDRVGEGDLGVAYHLYSYTHQHKFTMQVRMPRAQPDVPTVSNVWPTGAWHEREAFDLLGINFIGHPDPRRILLDDDWVGHPLRKDYVMPDQWDGVPLAGKDYTRNPLTEDEETIAPEGDGSDQE